MSEQSSINENNKPSSKVLRPPGGGSSDIFGADVPSTPRSVKNYMQSNIFSCEKGAMKNNGDQQRRAQKKEDSYSRLFGDPERPFTPAKNHMKSNIPFGGNAAVASKNGTTASNGNGHNASNGRNGKLENGELSSAASSVSSSSENLKMNGFSKTDGNPVTGEGYKPAGAEINTTIPSLNGANQVINKNRIPPGGFSSGLW